MTSNSNPTVSEQTAGASPARRRLVLASNNAHKLKEIREILGDEVEVLSLEQIGCHEELPETSDTIAGNALQKARRVRELFGCDCFADDTGLMVDALGGAPGVMTARYAGPHCSPDDNIALMLLSMADKTDRHARFATVIALIDDDGEHLFEGSVDGSIAYRRHGSGGFGYDPIFIPDETGISFAEMTPEAKNAISHRGRAVAKMADFILGGKK